MGLNPQMKIAKSDLKGVPMTFQKGKSGFNENFEIRFEKKRDIIRFSIVVLPHLKSSTYPTDLALTVGKTENFEKTLNFHWVFCQKK